MILLTAFVLGAMFGFGLGLGGMTTPAKIIGFLDVTGEWDPTLAFVMGGAVIVTFVSFPLILRRPHPVLGEHFVLPEKRSIDASLVLGAILFGVGWGLSGYCPGPSLVSLASGAKPAFVFVAFMAVGAYIAEPLRGIDLSNDRATKLEASSHDPGINQA